MGCWKVAEHELQRGSWMTRIQPQKDPVFRVIREFVVSSLTFIGANMLCCYRDLVSSCYIVRDLDNDSESVGN